MKHDDRRHDASANVGYGNTKLSIGTICEALSVTSVGKYDALAVEPVYAAMTPSFASSDEKRPSFA